MKNIITIIPAAWIPNNSIFPSYNKLPDCMIPVNSKPVIWHILDDLLNRKINNVLLLLNKDDIYTEKTDYEILNKQYNYHEGYYCKTCQEEAKERNEVQDKKGIFGHVFSSILKENEFYEAYYKAIKYVSIRMRSEKEISYYLNNKFDKNMCNVQSVYSTYRNRKTFYDIYVCNKNIN